MGGMGKVQSEADAGESRTLTDLVERIRENAAVTREWKPCESCSGVIVWAREALSCFACGETIHLDCAEAHLLTCDARMAVARPILRRVAR